MSFVSAIATNLNNWWINPTATSDMSFLQDLPLSVGLGGPINTQGYHSYEHWDAKIQLDKGGSTQLINNKDINISSVYNDDTSLMNFNTSAPNTWDPVTPCLSAFKPRYMRTDGYLNATSDTGKYAHGALPCTISINSGVGSRTFLVILTRHTITSSGWNHYYNNIYFETCRGNTNTFDICLGYGITSPPSSLTVYYKVLYAYTSPYNGGSNANLGLTFYGNSSYTKFTGISNPGSPKRYYQIGSVSCPGYPGSLVFWFDRMASEGV